MSGKKIFACLFDLDGVLFDGSPLHKRVLQKAIYEVNGYILGDSYHEATLEALPTKEKLEILQRNRIIEHDQKDRIFELKQKYTQEELEKLTMDWEKIQLFEFLRENKIKTAIVSNAIRKTIDIVINKIGIEEYINYIVSNEDVGKNTKPKPHPWWLAAFGLNIPKDNCFAIGDTDKDRISAEAAGIKYHIVKSYKEVNKQLMQRLLYG